MTPLPPALALSEPKSKLLVHLEMSPEVYALLAKEADSVYKELVGNRNNLKPSVHHTKPPYDWSHISERAREYYVQKLGSGGDQITSYYWHQGSALQNDLPWLPTWFLYKLFRHRDGRAKSSRGHTRSHSRSSMNGNNPTGGGNPPPVQNQTYSGFYSPPSNIQVQTYSPIYSTARTDEPTSRGFFDPVRGEFVYR